MTPMQDPTDFPEDIASASCDLAFLWRRSASTVFSTAHLTCESAFFWVKPRPLSNPSSCNCKKKKRTHKINNVDVVPQWLSKFSLSTTHAYILAQCQLVLLQHIHTKDTLLLLQPRQCMRTCSTSAIRSNV